MGGVIKGQLLLKNEGSETFQIWRGGQLAHVDSKSDVIFKIPIEGVELLSFNHYSKTKGQKISNLAWGLIGAREFQICQF